jgi:hypothetical protein
MRVVRTFPAHVHDRHGCAVRPAMTHGGTMVTGIFPRAHTGAPDALGAVHDDSERLSASRRGTDAARSSSARQA